VTPRFPQGSRRYRSVRVGVLLLVPVLLSGCAARRDGGLAKRFVKPGTPAMDVGKPAVMKTDKPAEPPKATVAEYAGKLRALAAQHGVKSFGTTLETNDRILSNALLGVQIAPSPLAHRRVAERYRELGILDSAYDHYAAAVQLDRTDAAAYEGLARVWRDWGFPQLGLADASRAVYFAPAWAVAHNTLGTLLVALGRAEAARNAYARALALDPNAAYVLNNVCYLSFLEGQSARAIAECEAALTIDPTFTAARNNLALANAAAGRSDEAKKQFMAAGDAAAALYNMGIVQLAGKQYAGAMKAFQEAYHARPTWAAALERAQQARKLDSSARSPAK